MSQRTLRSDIFPKKEQERIGIWVVGPPGSGKSTLCRGVARAMADRRFHIVDSDDPWFAWAKKNTPEQMAATISHFCHGLLSRPIIVSSVESPPDHDRWIVFGIDQPITDSIKSNPGAYDTWFNGQDEEVRAIDNWKASGVVHHVLEGDMRIMVAQVIDRICKEWPCSTQA